MAYRVVSVDGHTVQGSYRFTLAGPDGPAAAPASPAADPVPPPGSNGLMIGVGAGGLVLVAVALRLCLPGRRRAGH